MKGALIAEGAPVARFPIFLPVRCPGCNGQLELRTPNDVRCVSCGAGSRRITRDLERLKAVIDPEDSDLEKAAKRLHRLDAPHNGTHWYDLSAARRKQYLKGAREVVRTLREGLR